MSETTIPTIFISHTDQDSAHAKWLEEKLQNAYKGTAKIFLSKTHVDSKNRAIAPVKTAAAESSVFIALLSPASIASHWVTFEAGAAWLKDAPYVPICFGGVAYDDLPDPLKLDVQYRIALDEESVSLLFETVNKALRLSAIPPVHTIADYFARIRPDDYDGIEKTPSALIRELDTLKKENSLLRDENEALKTRANNVSFAPDAVFARATPDTKTGYFRDPETNLFLCPKCRDAEKVNYLTQAADGQYDCPIHRAIRVSVGHVGRSSRRFVP